MKKLFQSWGLAVALAGATACASLVERIGTIPESNGLVIRTQVNGLMNQIEQQGKEQIAGPSGAWSECVQEAFQRDSQSTPNYYSTCTTTEVRIERGYATVSRCGPDHIFYFTRGHPLSYEGVSGCFVENNGTLRLVTGRAYGVDLRELQTEGAQEMLIRKVIGELYNVHQESRNNE